MLLGGKALLTLSIGALGYLALSYVVLNMVVVPAFIDSEQNISDTNVERVQQALAAEFSQVATTAGDWAAWDAAVRFIEGQHATFVDVELASNPGREAHIDLLLFFDREGALIYGRLDDLSANLQLSLSQVDLRLIEDRAAVS